MIFSIIIYIFIGLLGIINFVIPNWDLPEPVYDVLSSSIASLNGLNFILPVDTILIFISLVLSFEISLLVFRVASGIISIIRGGGRIDI